MYEHSDYGEKMNCGKEDVNSWAITMDKRTDGVLGKQSDAEQESETI